MKSSTRVQQLGYHAALQFVHFMMHVIVVPFGCAHEYAKIVQPMVFAKGLFPKSMDYFGDGLEIIKSMERASLQTRQSSNSECIHFSVSLVLEAKFTSRSSAWQARFCALSLRIRAAPGSYLTGLSVSPAL